ncbi:MAG: magnesium transporter [Bacteroidetes bacterium]|nr:magnesium transporter [Bacteroidota bacterium]MCW5895245.1 magnesium transporter [Bacteroidota bacterium]
MIGKTIQPEIRALIEARDFATLKELFVDWNPADLADLIDDLPYEDQAIIFRLLPRALAADTYEYLAFEKQANLLKAMGREQVANILNDMAPDDRTALFEELPSAAVQQLIALLSPQERAIAQSLLNYPEESIGRLMTPDYIAVRQDWTVQDVLNYIRANGHDKETFDVIYIVDDKGKLVDDLPIREFLLATPDKKVSEMLDGNFVSLPVQADREMAIESFKKYDLTALPVVDSGNYLLGIVTVDDVLQVQEEETTEDIQKIGGTEALDQPYLEISIPQMVRKRAVWLVVLFLGEMFTATAMGVFEDEIARAVILALFVPLIISSGGNSGSQAATLIIRAMALGEVTLATWWRVMRREFLTGLSLGTILGIIGFMRIAGWSLFSDVYGEHAILIALTVGSSLIFIVMWGSLTGSMMPFVMKRLGADPATSSAPFVATLVDVTGVIIYFSVAAFLLRGTLL